jgi:hypothetical protein
MIIVCKKATKKLVKGLRYEVQNLYNDGKNQRWIESKVEIKGLGRYSVDNFTDIDGKPLPKINIINPRPAYKSLSFEELKEGDILVCTSDSYKTMAKDSMYRISKLITKSLEYKGYSGITHQRTEKSIQFEGIKRAIKFSSWRFRKLTPEETRELQLSQVLNGEKPNIITSSNIRKIDLTINKEMLLIQILSKSILDENRHHLSVLDWAIQKVGTNYSINKDDYSTLLEMPLKDILSKLS